MTTCDVANSQLLGRRFALQIGAIGYEFSSSSDAFSTTIRSRFTNCVCETPDNVGLKTHIIFENIGFDPSAPPANISMSDGLVEMKGNVGFSGTINLRAGEGELRVGAENHSVCVENYLRMANSILVLEAGGIQLHSAGVVRNGQGFVFFGPADAGKTTSATFSTDYRILSDDQNVLMPGTTGVTVVGVPFHSVACPVETVPGTAPIGRILRLIQDETTFITPIADATAVAMLASQSPFVNTLPDLTDRLLYNCEEIVKRVPIEALHFTRSKEFWTIL